MSRQAGWHIYTVNTLSSESSLPDSALPGCKELVGKDCGYIGSAGYTSPVQCKHAVQAYISDTEIEKSVVRISFREELQAKTNQPRNRTTTPLVHPCALTYFHASESPAKQTSQIHVQHWHHNQTSGNHNPPPARMQASLGCKPLWD